MKDIIRILTAALLIAAVLTSGGCAGMEENKREEIAENALEEKYGEEFTAVETSLADAGGFYAWLRPEQHPEIIFRAGMDDDGTGLMDDYPVKMLCHELTEKAEWELKEYKGELFICTQNALTYTAGDTKGTTIEEHFARNPEDRFYVAVFAEEAGAEFNELYDAAVRMRSSLGISRGSVDTYILEDCRLAEVQAEIERYDDMGTEEVKELLSGSRKFFIDLATDSEVPLFDEYRKGLEK